MTRKLRPEYAGACYHLIDWGNYRRNLFAGKGAAESFERFLGKAAERLGWKVHAYVPPRRRDRDPAFAQALRQAGSAFAEDNIRGCHFRLQPAASAGW